MIVVIEATGLSHIYGVWFLERRVFTLALCSRDVNTAVVLITEYFDKCSRMIIQ